MTKKRTLAIMAAGLGSRFGSLKQLYAINNNNNSIMDYSIFDAISAGFKLPKREPKPAAIIARVLFFVIENRYYKN